MSPADIQKQMKMRMIEIFESEYIIRFHNTAILSFSCDGCPVKKFCMIWFMTFQEKNVLYC